MEDQRADPVSGAAKYTFVLLQSPFATPLIWRWTAEALQEQGHGVLMPPFRFVHSEAPDYQTLVDSVVALCGPVRAKLVLVGHGGADPLIPAIAHALAAKIEHVILVESDLPPTSGFAEAAPLWLRDEIGYLAVRGRMPTWSKWWRSREMGTFEGDPDKWKLIEDDLRELIPAYFNQVIPVPPRWSERVDCSYLWFSESHKEDADEAARRGWRALHIAGGHLHMVVEPAKVAQALLSLPAR